MGGGGEDRNEERRKTHFLEDAFDNIKFITTYYNLLSFIKSSQSFKFRYNPRSLAKKEQLIITKRKKRDHNKEKRKDYNEENKKTERTKKKRKKLTYHVQLSPHPHQQDNT